MSANPDTHFVCLPQIAHNSEMHNSGLTWRFHRVYKIIMTQTLFVKTEVGSTK